MSTTAASQLPPAFPLPATRGTAGALRAWQEEALAAYLSRAGRAARDFLAVATPGAGKTTFALRVASDLLERRLVDAVTVVAPTEHLKHQWADAASRVGIALDPRFSNGDGAVAGGFTGVAVTYAQVAAHPLLHRRRTEARRTLVVLDEVHHGGDARSWGDAVREAFEPAARRLALTGTPFRSDTSPIPFVSYAPCPDGVRRSVADYSYGYGRALTDGVVRPVIFLSYAGEMRWRTRAGDEISATLGEPLTRDLTAAAWRTALDPRGNWIPAVLAAADRRLIEVRRRVPDAGGLVIATDQAAARSYARQLRAITGERQRRLGPGRLGPRLTLGLDPSLEVDEVGLHSLGHAAVLFGLAPLAVRLVASRRQQRLRRPLFPLGGALLGSPCLLLVIRHACLRKLLSTGNTKAPGREPLQSVYGPTR
jgi:superfamily II DNA or RNA helicase